MDVQRHKSPLSAEGVATTEHTTVYSPQVLLDFGEKKVVHVLLVDYEPSLLKVAKQLLENEGQFQVDTAASVEEALQKMRKETYDAVVSDYQMPGKDGLEFLKELRGRGNTVPFIIFTGKGREEVAISVLNSGADQWVSKTGDPETVYRSLAHAINASIKRKRDETRIRYDAMLMQNVNEGIIAFDENFRITSLNLAAEKMYGCKAHEVVGRDAMEVFRPVTERTANAAEPGLFQSLRSTGRFHGEMICRKRNGKPIHAEVTVVALRGKSNRIIGYVSMNHDITERKDAEQSFIETKQKFEGLFTGNPEATVYIGPDFHILDINPRFQELFGYALDEIKGKHLNDVVVPKDKIREGKMLDKKAIQGYVYHDTYRMRKDGYLVPVSISAAPISVEGKLIGYIGVYKDISQLKETETVLQTTMARLADMNEKLRVVGGLTRHDARNKLSIISGNTYLLKKELSGNIKALDDLGEIEMAVQQVVKIFDFAKAYEMLGAEELVYVDVERTVNEAASLFSSLKSIKVINNCSGLAVLADSLLRQLFYNLIDNSIKHGQKITVIRVYHEEEEQDWLKLVYEDDGVGISWAAKTKLFKEGYSTGGSTGYGLYLIRKMTEVYGWTIQETGEPGKGARFTITIPRTNVNGRNNYRFV
jgi:PAS domain S-box-containing protein